jgi:hypothetical protein
VRSLKQIACRKKQKEVTRIISSSSSFSIS